MVGIVHDLGNLIQVATSALNIISRQHGSDGSLSPTVETARISLQRAGALVRETMKIAHDGKMAFPIVDVASCLREAEELITTTWDANTRLAMSVAADLTTVRCSRVSLQSVLMNLLMNARDAMPDGGTINVVANNIYSEDELVALELHVRDTGFGMSDEILRHSTEPFFTTKPGGLGGLGLPMVKRFVHELGGRLDIQSEVGCGTTATIVIPATSTKTPAEVE